MTGRSGAEVLDSRRRTGAIRAAQTLSALAALGCGITAAAMLSLDDPYMRRVGWGWLANSLVSVAALVALVLRRGWTAGQGEAVALLVSVTTLVTQVHADWNSALSGARFASFEGFKVLALAVATVVPFRPAWAYALVTACAAIPVALYTAMPAAMRAKLPIEEPWTALVYPLLAAGILVYRVRALRLEREMMRARAEREALERLARVSLAYRDLANSPLQAIELLRAELQRRHPESGQLLQLLRSCLSRLRAMGEMLSQTEHQVVWTSKEEAFDAAEVIADYHRAVAS